MTRVDYGRTSKRQKRDMDLARFIGQAEYVGQLESFLPPLLLGMGGMR